MRQLAVTMSPTARLLDFLAYKYKILFIISAGNHPEIIDFVEQSFDDLKSLDIAQPCVINSKNAKNCEVV